MPRMDGTGPAGQGPMTGRGLGPCGTGGMRVPMQNQYQVGWFGRLAGMFGARNYYGGMGRGGGRRGQGRGRMRAF